MEERQKIEREIKTLSLHDYFSLVTTRFPFGSTAATRQPWNEKNSLMVSNL